MSANEYARQRGREASPSPQPSPRKGEGAKPHPLSAAAQARVHQNRALVHEHMPEALPFIKELHELGMIDGWRNVEEVTLTPTANAGSLP